MFEMGRNKSLIKDLALSITVNRAIKLFKLEEQQPIHLNDIFDYDLDIRNSSPGVPWEPAYKTRGEVMDDPAARNSIRLFWHRIKDGEDIPPPKCKVLYPAHMQRDTPNFCAVYDYPTTLTLMEACFCLPLTDAYKQGKAPIGYGYDMVTGGANSLRRRLMGVKGNNYGCFKFSNFDKNTTRQLIEVAFCILMMNIDFTAHRGGGIPRLDRLVRAWDYLVRYFIETPLLLGNGTCWKKSAGIPSGSYFAQLIRSIVNWIIINYTFLKLYGQFPEDCIVFGEDSVVTSSVKFSALSMSEFTNKFGIEINPVTSIVTTNINEVEFLGLQIKDN